MYHGGGQIDLRAVLQQTKRYTLGSAMLLAT